MLLKQYDVSHGLPSGNINLVSPCTFHSQPPDKTIKKQYGLPKRLKRVHTAFDTNSAKGGIGTE